MQLFPVFVVLFFNTIRAIKEQQKQSDLPIYCTFYNILVILAGYLHLDIRGMQRHIHTNALKMKITLTQKSSKNIL